MKNETPIFWFQMILVIFCTASTVFSLRPQKIDGGSIIRFRNTPKQLQNSPKVLFNQARPKATLTAPLSAGFFKNGGSSRFSVPQFAAANNNRLFSTVFKKPQMVRKPSFSSNTVRRQNPQAPMSSSTFANKISGKMEAPGAYSWGYKWVDESGTQMFREETADGMGTVWGRYSFREANGRLRIVEYVSDPEHGFRTRIRSNEAGIVTSNPANAIIVRFEDESELEDGADFDFGTSGRKRSSFFNGARNSYKFLGRNKGQFQ